MKTLTITDAKRNLGKWLEAAARGQEIGIISGADIIALRKVEIQATDYAWNEYRATEKEIAGYETGVMAKHQRLKKAGKINYLDSEDLRKRSEKAARD